MAMSFEGDPYPGKPRILFVALAESTHTHSWIDLLKDAGLNVRLFALPTGLPPKDWWVRTYLTSKSTFEGNPRTTARLYSYGRAGRLAMRSVARFLLKNDLAFEERWLAQIIRRWQPHVIHTLGLEPASYFLLRVLEKYPVNMEGKWVVSVRGGPDLALHRLIPEYEGLIRRVLQRCDQLVADNDRNFHYALLMGMESGKVASLGKVPGTGGVDVEAIGALWKDPPSRRKRLILVPKAYECPQSKVLPILEAIRLAWEKIRPSEIHMLATIPETRMWFQTLPEELRSACTLYDRIPRPRVLELMAHARVMLAPSLADGTPNSLLEAMAAGAFPILSPLETITPIVESGKNVLFARNLYPEELAAALVRAMTDNELVDRAAERNLELVRHLADRNKIGPRVIDFYNDLAGKVDPS